MNGPEELRERFCQWWNEGRFDQIEQLFYTDDAILIPAGQATIRGRAGVVAFLRQMHGSLGRVVLPNEESDVEAGLGYIVGRFSFPDADPPMNGMTTEVYRREPDGSWRCAVDMFQPAA